MLFIHCIMHLFDRFWVSTTFELLRSQFHTHIYVTLYDYKRIQRERTLSNTTTFFRLKQLVVVGSRGGNSLNPLLE
jgi:hypothetical protein